ncbi:MAG: 4Fe-4S dicluster domain-containing protein [Syntrophales bacterium]|nr:4Fe-4S dicluster domain-containing protein [Syntrophales bacterium]
MKKFAIENLSGVIASLQQKGKVFAPVKEKDGFYFREIADPGDATLDFYNTVMSPKHLFFPQTEDMIKYRINKEGADSAPVPINSGPQILFGVRPPDVRSFELMDLLFEEGGIIDPYWVDKRKNTIVIGYAFDSVDPLDFYNTFDIHAADPRGSDIFLVRKDRTVLARAFTGKGEALLDGLAGLENASAADEKAFEDAVKKGPGLKTRKLDLNGVAKKLEAIFDAPYWQKASMACLNCGVCTFVCPTCSCFDICDETLFRDGRRCRTWDSCMFTNFTLEASGHNPRTRAFQRFRQRINHKFSYYVSKFGVTSCVGCGRCSRYCPVNIDIFSVVEKAKEV